MVKINRGLFLAALLLFIPPSTLAQSTSPEQKPTTASIEGKVSLNGRPARGVTVTAVLDDGNQLKMFQHVMEGFAGIMFRAKTDEIGQYRIENLAAGRYEVFVIAPAMVTAPVTEETRAKPASRKDDKDDDDDDDDDDTSAAGARMSSNERQVSLEEGEAAKDVNFLMNRGGVITGRITYADGRPVIGETVALTPMAAGSAFGRRLVVGGDSDRFTTDDRGIYRIYGVADGSYKVSVIFQQKDLMDVVAKKGHVKTTYYPGVTDEKVATPVEVKNGGEIRGLDFRLGVAANTFTVSGRVIEAETGKPVANVIVGYDGSGTGFGKANAPTNARGEFKINGIPTGTYRLSNFADFTGQSDHFSDSVSFEVKEADVTGVDLKLHRGLAVSGGVAIEGASDTSHMEKLVQLELMAFSTANAADPGGDGLALAGAGFSRTRINPDGSFTFRGIRPGKVRFELFDMFGTAKLALVRLERSGIDQRGEIDLRQGDTVTDVRLVFAIANGVIRGQVRAEDGSSLKDVEIKVKARRVGAVGGRLTYNSDIEETETDITGQFVLDGLLAGEYEITVTAVLPRKRGGDEEPGSKSATQTVFVSSDREAQVQFTLAVKAMDKDK